MAAIATITLTCPVTGLPGGTENINPPVLTVTPALGVVSSYILASGDNTVTVPTGAKKILILPPVGNTVVILLKKTGADTGLPLDLVDWSFLSVGTMTTFVLNAASLMSSAVTIYFE